MKGIVETVAIARDRTWVAMRMGVVFERWPGDEAPSVGTRVVVFDRDLEFMQHGVLEADGMRITLGPALPWDEDDGDEGIRIVREPSVL